MSPIEYFDGFAADYGASYTDLLANAAGVLFFWFQHKAYKQIICFPKFSFWPSPYAAMRPNVLGHNLWQNILKDYNGQIYWLNISANSLLPNGYKVAPAWFYLSVGYGAEQMVYGRVKQNEAIGLHPERQYYFSFNISLRETGVFKRYHNNTVIRAIVFWFEGYQLPAPCIELSNSGFRLHIINF